MHGYIDIGDAVNRDASLNRGLVSWWLALPGQQRGVMWRDLMGRNHGTLTSMDPPTDWCGPVGRSGGFGSLNFDNTNDYVLTAAASVGTTYSVAAWCMLSAAGNFPMVVTGNGTNSDLRFNASTRIPQFRGLSGPSAIALNTWVHLLVTVTAGTSRLYVNGITDGATGSAAPQLTALQIGRRSDGFYFPGWIDDVRLYSDRALSDLEAWRVYQASRLGYPNELNWIQRPAFAPEQGGGGGFNPVYARWSNIVIQPLTAA